MSGGVLRLVAGVRLVAEVRLLRLVSGGGAFGSAQNFPTETGVDDQEQNFPTDTPVSGVAETGVDDPTPKTRAEYGSNDRLFLLKQTLLAVAAGSPDA